MQVPFCKIPIAVGNSMAAASKRKTVPEREKAACLNRKTGASFSVHGGAPGCPLHPPGKEKPLNIRLRPLQKGFFAPMVFAWLAHCRHPHCNEYIVSDTEIGDGYGKQHGEPRCGAAESLRGSQYCRNTGRSAGRRGSMLHRAARGRAVCHKGRRMHMRHTPADVHPDSHQVLCACRNRKRCIYL